MKVTIGVLYIMFIHGVVRTKKFIDNACNESSIGVVCCSGYFEHGGRCIECFGAIGINCSEPCQNTTYGYQCKKNCSCSHNEVCNKYIGCVQFVAERDSENVNTLLIVLVGFGSSSLSLCLIFVGVMFYRWRQHLQRIFRPTQKREGFQVDLFSVPSNQEIHIENYVNVRESRMSVDDMQNHMHETGEYRINSMEYNHLFSSANVVRQSVNNHNEQVYNTADARFTRKETLVTFSEFPNDDCYVSLSHKAKKSNRLSKSCSDLRVEMSKAHSLYAKKENIDGNVLIEHL